MMYTSVDAEHVCAVPVKAIFRIQDRKLWIELVL